jgi:RNA polymerase sigma-70 factor (ECF subfamily)
MAIAHTTETSQDELLAVAAREGDRGAYTRLVDKYRDLVIAFAFSRLHDREEAEDVAQDCFVRAYANLSSYNPNRPWVAWLMTIARNACHDRLRRKRVRNHIELNENLESGTPGPERSVLEDMDKERLISDVMTLPDAQRMPLLMHYAGGCTYHEIATALDIPYSTVVGRLAGALRSLRRKMGADSR